MVLGDGERAEAHRAWYRQAGLELVPPGRGDGADLPEAAVYDLCLDPEKQPPVLGLLLRRRHAAILLAGRVAATAAAAARLAATAQRRRCSVAVSGGLRFVPAMARLRELVCGGSCGAVREVVVELRVSPAAAPEARLAGLDLGVWLAGDALLTAAGAAGARISVQAGTAQVALDTTLAAAQPGAAWRVRLAADLGHALATASTAPGLPGRPCRDQTLLLTIAGRTRRLDLPEADAAGSELAALVARRAAGQPWLGLCSVERAARLLAALEEGPAKVAAASQPELTSP